MKYSKLPRFALALALLLPLQLLAAGTANLITDNQSHQLLWDDQQMVRMNMPDEGAYMLLRAGKVYMISPQAAGGMPMVMEIGGMMQGMAAAAMSESNSPLTQRIESIKATGATEEIADITGHVYDVVLKDAQGKTENKQLVLTDNAAVTDMTNAFFELSGTMLGKQVLDDFKNSLPTDRRGLLRAGNDLVLQSISSDKPAAGSFDLPAEPTDMGNMMQNLMQQLQQMEQ